MDSVGNLSSPGCSAINVMQLFNRSSRRARSHGHRHYNPPIIHQVSFDELLPYIQTPLGVHHIRTKLFSIPLTTLKRLSSECLDSIYRDVYSAEYKLKAIICDIAHNRLYKPVSEHSNDAGKSFLKIRFANKGIDAVNISNILHHKKVMSKIPPYFEQQSAPLISYTYTRPIATKIFNHKRVLKNLILEDIKSKPPSCSCSSSPFMYSPVGHVVTGDLTIIKNEQLRGLLSKGPKYREPKSFNWNFNFKLLMDSVEDYARRWAKREKVEADTLSDWIRAIRDLIKSRIKHLRESMSTNLTSILDQPCTKRQLSDLHDKYVIVPADKAPNNIVFVCKRYYVDCLIEELGINKTHGNATYTPTALTKREILNNHLSVLQSFGVKTDPEEFELPALYWMPKLHKCPYKQRYIAGSAKCSTKPLSKLLTRILSAVKDGLQTYCETAYFRSGVNQM